ncbi:MAG: hypothetical protein ABI969_09940, partial [bacterium]
VQLLLALWFHLFLHPLLRMSLLERIGTLDVSGADEMGGQLWLMSQKNCAKPLSALSLTLLRPKNRHDPIVI